MRRRTRLLMILVVATRLAACGGAPGFTWKETPGSLVRSFEGCDPRSEAALCTNVVFEWPRLEGQGAAATEVSAFIDQQMRSPVLGEEPAESLDAVADGFLAEYRSFIEEFSENEFPWVLERKMQVLWQGERLLTLVLREYSYLGGAHPNTAQSYWVLDRASGLRVGLADLLVEDFDAALAAVAEEAFRQLHDVPEGQGLEAAGFWFDQDTFVLNDNWAVDGVSLRFYYNPYEVAAYALGPTEIELPRATIADLIRPDGPWR